MKVSNALSRPAVRVALGVAVILVLPLVAMQFTDEVVWTVWDFIAVGVLLTVIGVAIELAVKRAGNRVLAIGIAALGVFCGLWGEAGDAPGLVLIGIVLLACACAVGVRSARRGKRTLAES